MAKTPKQNDLPKNKPFIPKTPGAEKPSKKDKNEPDPNYPFFPNLPNPTEPEGKPPKTPDTQQGL